MPISPKKSKRTSSTTKSLLCLLVASMLLSCHASRSGVGSRPKPDFHELAKAGIRLGFDIEIDDNWPLLVESSRWLSVPYKFGGNNEQGVDCSGLNCAIYQRVFQKRLHRNSREQYEKDCHHVSRRHLQQGDLVFFAPDGKKKNINHTGIFLKNDLFLHASSSRGVIVSSLDNRYYQRIWVGGGRVKD